MRSDPHNSLYDSVNTLKSRQAPGDPRTGLYVEILESAQTATGPEQDAEHDGLYAIPGEALCKCPAHAIRLFVAPISLHPTQTDEDEVNPHMENSYMAVEQVAEQSGLYASPEEALCKCCIAMPLCGPNLTTSITNRRGRGKPVHGGFVRK